MPEEPERVYGFHVIAKGHWSRRDSHRTEAGAITTELSPP